MIISPLRGCVYSLHFYNHITLRGCDMRFNFNFYNYGTPSGFCHDLALASKGLIQIEYFPLIRYFLSSPIMLPYFAFNKPEGLTRLVCRAWQ